MADPMDSRRTVTGRYAVTEQAHTGPEPDRNLALELVRATEAAAIGGARHLGRGDKEAVDQAAVDAMRPVLGQIAMDGVVVIGEGEKDNAPMLYNGERVGSGSPPQVDIAVDPVDGTTLTAKSLPNAIAVVALAERGTMFDPGPCVYMEKLAVGRPFADVVDFEAPIEDNLRRIAAAKDSDVTELTVCILDRPRHEEELVGRVRATGARIKFLLDGDVAGAIMAAREETGIDLAVGIGGTPEGVITACALKCLGGAMYGRLWPRRRRAPGRPGRRLRPRQGPHHRRPGPGRQRLLRRHRRHRRRAAPRGPLPPQRGADPVPVDALGVRARSA